MKDAAQTGQRTVEDSEWARIETLPEDQREAAMRARYLVLAAQPEEERRELLHAMALMEYALPDDRLKPFTRSRMKVLLTLDGASAKAVATSYDSVMNTLPGTAAMRRVALVQSLAREFTQAEQLVLKDLVPGIFTVQLSSLVAAPSVEKRSRPWWAFWQSG